MGCVWALRQLTYFRSALLDRILQLELSAGQAYQPPINGPLGTERESRFRDRITSALSPAADSNSDPYTRSAHCGPAAVQEYQQKYANMSVHGDRPTGTEFDSTPAGKGSGSPNKRPAGRGPKTATVDESLSAAPSVVPATSASFALSSTTSHPPAPEPASQPGPTMRPIPKIRVKPITPQPAMNAPAHVPSSNSLSNLLDGNSTYRDSTTPSEAAATAPEGSASS
jgi:hypothetical protein